jgi:L-alanine-DL-glutamate epimerase-like enolase superfamily enzyme
VEVGSSRRNAGIGFGSMTVSAVAVVSDARRGGAALTGLGLGSIGRYAHGGLLRERFMPRLRAAAPADYADGSGDSIDPCRAWDLLMRDEKPGGHGERSGAVGVLDAALWDLAAKIADLPLWRLLARRFGNSSAPPLVPTYASGGHYCPGDDLESLRQELRQAQARGHTRFKIKIGGAPLADDLRRIEAALEVAGGGEHLAVDANGVLDRSRAFRYVEALQGYRLAWLEEPADPLDFELYAEIARAWPGSLGTGENLFSAADARNLLRYAGLRRERDWLQMDPLLGYGVPEYLRMLEAVEAAGWSRRRCVPHAGHLFAQHLAAGLGLGGHESATDPGQPFGALAGDATLEQGVVRLGEAPGIGIEATPSCLALFGVLLP